MSAGDALMSPAAGDDAKAELGVNAQFSREAESVEVTPSGPVIGLTKEQLEKYRNEPFYRTLRWILFALFWLTWAALFCGALALIFLSPRKVKATPDPQKNANAYEIFIPGFYDSDNNGEGDFAGVVQKFDYLADLNVDTLILTPVFKTDKDHFSPVKTESWSEIDERFGGQGGFESLVKAAANKFKIFVDVPINENATVDKLVQGVKLVEKLGADGVYIVQPSNSTDIYDAKNLDLLINGIRSEIPDEKFAIYVNSQELLDLATTKANVVVLDTVVENGENVLDIFLASVADAVNGNTSLTLVQNSVRRERLGSKLPKENRPSLLSLLNALRLVAYPVAINTYGDEVGLLDSASSRHESYLGYYPWDESANHKGFTTFEEALLFDPLVPAGTTDDQSDIRKKFSVLSTIRRNFKFGAAKTTKHTVIRDAADGSGIYVLFFNPDNQDAQIKYSDILPSSVEGLNKVSIIHDDGVDSTKIEDYTEKVEHFEPYQYRIVKLHNK
uniref:Aamy domain-containing protein n=1 Tax=Panagrellus redivivus TaxID=6233 RepID=A0A7E4ZZQ6_PANRE